MLIAAFKNIAAIFVLQTRKIKPFIAKKMYMSSDKIAEGT
jgi:hypothetical protein